MRCNYIPRQHARLIKRLAATAAEQQLDDAATRAQYLWMAAMLNAGLSPRTVARVTGQLPAVYHKYGEARQDGLGDYALVSDLRRAGLDVAMPRDEL